MTNFAHSVQHSLRKFLLSISIFHRVPPRTNIGVTKFALGDPTSGTILLRLDPVGKTHSGPRRRGASIPGDGGTRGAIRLIRGLTDVGPVGGGGLLICVRGCLHSENRFPDRTLLDSLQYTPDDPILTVTHQNNSSVSSNDTNFQKNRRENGWCKTVDR